MKPLHIPTAMKGKPSWADPDGEATFWHGEPFNGGSSWIGRFRGVSPWEMHPDGDELLHVLKGAVDIVVLKSKGRSRVKLKPGSMFVVPRGHWHRHESRGFTLECGVTSGRTRHSMEADPRRR